MYQYLKWMRLFSKWDLARVDQYSFSSNRKAVRGRRARLSGRFWDTTFLVILFQLLRHHHRCKYYVVKFYVCAVLGFTFYFDSYAWDFWRVFKFRHTFLVSQINMLILVLYKFFLYLVCTIYGLVLYKLALYFGNIIS